MSFEIQIGGKNPEEKTPEVPEVETQLNSENIDPNKWYNCAYRSDKTEYYLQSCCGHGPEKHVGYICSKLDIKDLNPLICSRCNFFSQKEITPSN